MEERLGQHGVAVLAPLALTRITMRSLSMSESLSETTSEALRPAP